MSLAKTYQPTDIETAIYQYWEDNGFFSPNGKGEPYSIMLPPPNVTGSLHMGHGFGFTLIDILIRYERMCGKNTKWQAGTDHAGIATQMVVERMLNIEGKTRHDLGRDAFITKIWSWKNESGGNIARQLRRLGASLDWQNERFTLDEGLSQAVREVFIQLFEEGIIYQGERLVNWDPALQTAISDLEVVSEQEEGKLWTIRYPLVQGEGFVDIATTRPETLLGDVAVSVNPKDERYQMLVGKYLQLPLTERQIPIIADDYVDPAFGTGCVKITPAHDFNDYAVGLRHQLTPLNIFTKTANLNDNVPKAYRGLDRFQARKKILEDLKDINLLIKEEKHLLNVPRGERSGVVIEPFLTKQWFMKMKMLAKPAIEAVESGEIRFIPANWQKTYFQWMNHIEDWCISRQLWWGHRIPAWYDERGKAYVGHDEAKVRQKYNLSDEITLRQDEDVLDTWFSSALWPFSTLGWPEKTDDFKTFFPTSLLVTGFDIIFFWVARMIMMSLKLTNKIPFKAVYITGLIRDAEGHKMSKSKGNVLDPIDLIDGIHLDQLIQKRTYGLMQPAKAEKIKKNTQKEFPDGIPSYGTDALRFTFCSLASYTREIRFDVNRLAGYRHFCNKLWNASRYVLMNIDNHVIEGKKTFSTADRWIWSLLQKTISDAHQALAQYRFDLFAQCLYDFTWNEFCDWYLELSKPILTDDEADENLKRGTRYTLINVLETLLKLLHPIIPFITEAIWKRLFPFKSQTVTSIMLASYPQADKAFIDEDSEKEITWLKQMIVAVRTIRSEMNIAPGKKLNLLLRKGNSEDKKYLKTHEQFFKRLAKLENIEYLDEQETPPPAASAFINRLELYIPFANFINKNEEEIRIQKEMAKIKKELDQLETKLQNPNFIDKAPQEIVTKVKKSQSELGMKFKKLEQQLQQLLEIGNQGNED